MCVCSPAGGIVSFNPEHTKTSEMFFFCSPCTNFCRYCLSSCAIREAQAQRNYTRYITNAGTPKLPRPPRSSSSYRAQHVRTRRTRVDAVPGRARTFLGESYIKWNNGVCMPRVYFMLVLFMSRTRTWRWRWLFVVVVVLWYFF